MGRKDEEQRRMEADCSRRPKLTLSCSTEETEGSVTSRRVRVTK
jgi:hypothetical protein